MVLVFLKIFIFSLISFVIISIVFKNLNIVDLPDGKLKLHKKIVPYSGGLVCFLVFLFFVLFLEIDIKMFEATKLNQFIFIFILFLIFILGFVDDVIKVSALARFILLIIIFILCLSYFENFVLNYIYFSKYFEKINIHPYGVIITSFFILAFVQSTNMIDGIDGQFGLYFLFLILYSNYFVLNYTLNFIPFIIIYLIFNYKKKSFIGDGGTYFLSFLIGVTFISLHNRGLIFADDVYIAMSFPGYDMIRLFFNRIKKRKNPFLGDREHIHHLFLNRFKENTVFIISPLFLSLPILLKFIFDNNFFVILFSLLIYTTTIIYLKNYNK